MATSFVIDEVRSRCSEPDEKGPLEAGLFEERRECAPLQLMCKPPFTENSAPVE